MISGKNKSFCILIYRWISIPIALLLTLIFLLMIYSFSLFNNYELNILNSDLIIAFLAIIVAYYYLLCCIIILIGFFRKYNKLIYYVVFLTPIIPELFIFLRFYQSRELLNEYISILFLLLLLISYSLLAVFTLLFVRKSSFNIIRDIVGKDLFEVQDDYSYISIFSKTSPEEGNIVKLIKNIISNFLEYKIEYIKHINIDGKIYKIYNYTKQDWYFKFHENNILLIEFDVIISDNHKQVKIFNRSDEDGEKIHKCVYLYQFYDDGDEISDLPSTYQDVYLALKGILPKDSLIFYHKDDDITPPEIWDLRYNLFKKYLLLRYGTLIDRTDIRIKDIIQRLKEPHKKVIKYIIIFISILIFIICIYNSIHNYLFTLKIETLITIGLLFPPAIHYSIKIYDRLKNK